MHWSLRNRLLARVSLAALATAAPAFAQDPNARVEGVFGSLPAVSAPNFFGDFRSGEYDEEFGAIGTGAFAFPLGHAFGAQGDLHFGVLGGNVIAGGAGHLF